ncbi:MAG: molybdopterin-dependent oxidoreductase [Clostridiales bacterium]|nr:molybdopterin-dependent oxidoreductase [Clostridiales bacterium]
MAEQIMTSCAIGGPVFVHVEDGRITKIRPIVFGEDDPEPWTIEARGKTFSPPRQFSLGSYVVTQKARIYSENRIKYPMKRVDFDPDGERNPQNRGKSGYVRITWDEAFGMLESEIKRIHGAYGKAAITASTSSHADFGLLQYKMGPFGRFWNMLGYSQLMDNPDSWEGWHWGATHAWGYYWKLGVSDNFGMLEEALKHTELLVMWGVDPNTSAGGYNGQDGCRWRLWCKELGMKMVFIDPWCNFTAGPWADKWIAPWPATDGAMAEAIAWVWITEDTYDHWFIEEKTIGFEEFRKHILGDEEGGFARTPAWAAGVCGVNARDIYALAREWASKKTMLCTGSIYGVSGASRNPYATEWARLMVFLLAMRGLGADGCNTWGGASMAPPMDMDFRMFGYSDNGWDALGLVAEETAQNTVNQKTYRLLLPECVMNEKTEWIGEGFCGNSLEQQLTRQVCPLPKEEGGAPIKMIYRQGGSFISTMTDTNRWPKMFQHPNLEFFVTSDIHWQSETRFADLVLPACSGFEREDICELGAPGGYGANDMGANYRVCIYMKKCIEPLWESKSDYDIYVELSKRLGFHDRFTEGKEMTDWIEKIFHKSSLPGYITFEEFKEKGYFIVPPPEPGSEAAVSNKWYYEDREVDVPDHKNPLKGTERAKMMGTPSGKIEFVSTFLSEHFPGDKERPVMGRYLDPWEGKGSPLAEKYPLVLMTPHMRFSYHTQFDNKSPWLDEIPAHRAMKDGYAYWIVRMHQEDARARGIRHGDLVKLYNDRGAILAVAYLTERMKPGVLMSYQAGAKYDPLEPGKPGSIDRGGCVNLLTPSRMVSKNAPGMVSNSVCAEIERWEG